MGDRIEFVGMALRAAGGQAQPRFAGGRHAIDHGIKSVFQRINTAFFVEHGVAMKTRRDAILRGCIRQQVASNLADGELIKWQIGIDGIDDPIAPRPQRTLTIFFIAIGVGVTRQIEPFARPPFAVTRRGQQTID